MKNIKTKLTQSVNKLLLITGLLFATGISRAQWASSNPNVQFSYSGSVAIGPMAPAGPLYKLDVTEDDSNPGAVAGHFVYTSNSNAGPFNGIYGLFDASPFSNIAVGTGIEGVATGGSTSNTGAIGYGVKGSASGSAFNYGGYFESLASGGALASSRNIGVYGKVNSSVGVINTGVYGEDNGGAAGTDAGYFLGTLRAVNSTAAAPASIILHDQNGSGQPWLFNSDNSGNFKIKSTTTDRMYIDGSNGNVGIGTTSPSDLLSVEGNVVPATDNVYTSGTSAHRWNELFCTNTTINVSDMRKKTNIEDLKYGINEILQLRPISFRWTEKDNGIRLGLVAQELQKVVNEVVYVGSDEEALLGVRYVELIPILIKGIQDQQKQIEEQNQRIDELSGKASSSTGLKTNNGLIPGFTMEQNEPNPFTHETLIKYNLPTQINSAFMMVYDLSGKQIASFSLDQKGASAITITSEKLAAGIYIYSIIADGKIMDSKRMVVAEK